MKFITELLKNQPDLIEDTRPTFDNLRREGTLKTAVERA